MYQLSFSKKLKNTSIKVDQLKIIDKNIFSNFSLLFWEEHCVECELEGKINTCKTHTKRPDGGCATLENGFELIKNNRVIDGFSVKVKFKTLAKIESQWPFRPKMYKPHSYKIFSYIFHSIDNFFSPNSNFSNFLKSKKWKLYEKLRSYIYRLYKYIANYENTYLKPDYLIFQIENLNPNNETNLQIEIISDNKISYRNNLILNDELNTFLIDFNDLSFGLSKENLFRIWSEDTVCPDILIHWAHIVKLKNKQKEILKLQKHIISNDPYKSNENKVKCVVFDLDNTIWEGIIGDDKFSEVKLNPNILKFLRDLDSRGILCSIASKNEYEIAWKKIVDLKIQDYFLYPEIHWGEKYISIQNIANNLNIGLDSIVFIDDSSYEQRAIKNFLPEIRIFESITSNLINNEIFDVPITNESTNRRKFYLSDGHRKREKQLNKLDDLSFIKSSNLKLQILNVDNNLIRCSELIQRTNQFNISKEKLNVDELNLHIKNYHSLCWQLNDKYGNYGIVGFLSFRILQNTLEMDKFAMSCRSASRFVEESIISWLCNMYQDEIKSIIIKINKTDRNNPIYEKIKQIGFKKMKKENDTEFLILNLINHSDFLDVIEIIDKRIN